MPLVFILELYKYIIIARNTSCSNLTRVLTCVFYLLMQLLSVNSILLWNIMFCYFACVCFDLILSISSYACTSRSQPLHGRRFGTWFFIFALLCLLTFWRILYLSACTDICRTEFVHLDTCIFNIYPYVCCLSSKCLVHTTQAVVKPSAKFQPRRTTPAALASPTTTAAQQHSKARGNSSGSGGGNLHQKSGKRKGPVVRVSVAGQPNVQGLITIATVEGVGEVSPCLSFMTWIVAHRLIYKTSIIAIYKHVSII